MRQNSCRYTKHAKLLVCANLVVAFSFLGDLGGKVLWFIPRLRFFFRWRSARAYQFHFFFKGQDQSTMAQRAKTTVAECFLTSCGWVRFPDRFLHYAWTAKSAHSDSIGSRVYACLGVTCHLYFGQNDPGLLRATVVTRGWTEHRIRVSKES